MAITKAGKQLYKFYTQVLVRISSGIRFFLKKIPFESAMVSRFMAVAHLACSVAFFFNYVIFNENIKDKLCSLSYGHN